MTTTTLKTAIQNEAIAGHEEAIANLKNSTEGRLKRMKEPRYIQPKYHIAMSHLQNYELSRIEILELELKGLRGAIA